MKRNYVMESLGEMKAMYATYNEAMVALAPKNENIVLLYGDFPRAASGALFEKEYPDRIYDVGIAEANLITTAAGLAGAGKIPFTHCHSIFAVGRAYNQIRQNVAFDKLNVKIVLCNSGMLWNFMGGSHQIIEEIAALRVIPNLALVSPADPVETKKVTRAAAEHVGPVAIRLSNPPRTHHIPRGLSVRTRESGNPSGRRRRHHNFHRNDASRRLGSYRYSGQRGHQDAPAQYAHHQTAG